MRKSALAAAVLAAPAVARAHVTLNPHASTFVVPASSRSLGTRTFMTANEPAVTTAAGRGRVCGRGLAPPGRSATRER